MLNSIEVLQLAKKKEVLKEEDNCCVFIDLTVVNYFLSLIKELFPNDSDHFIPIKTNPLNAVQKYILSKGFGLEASSLNEVRLAQLNGAENGKIVFNSPAKSNFVHQEMDDGFDGLNLHYNDLDEFNLFQNPKFGGRVLRINPLTKSSSRKEFFVSSNDSKFGEQLTDNKFIVKKICNTLINGLHVHQASSFSNFSEQVSGIRRVVDLANEINAINQNQILSINIGGGFQGVKIASIHLFKEYVNELKITCPELFDGTYRLGTEFGRFVYENSAFIFSKINCVKSNTGKDNLIINIGANLFVREVYTDKKIEKNQVSLLTSAFKLKEGKVFKDYTIDGPLCFSGDRLLSSISLPVVESDDVLIIDGIGANTFSLYSMHCSHSFPKVVLYNGAEFKLAKEKQTIDDIYSFWGL